MYKIVNIGGSFSNNDRGTLEASLNKFAAEGWELDTIFSVTHRSCLSSANTNLMILRKADGRSTQAP